jgi:hypothetical protein
MAEQRVSLVLLPLMGGSSGRVDTVDASGLVLDLLALDFLLLLGSDVLLDLVVSLEAFDFLAPGCSVEDSSSSNFFGFLVRLPVTCASALPSAHHSSILLDLRDMMLRELRNGTSRQWSYGVDLQINGVCKQYNDNEIAMEI